MCWGLVTGGAGLMLGTIWANRVERKTGTVACMSRVSGLPQRDHPAKPE